MAPFGWHALPQRQQAKGAHVPSPFQAELRVLPPSAALAQLARVAAASPPPCRCPVPSHQEESGTAPRTLVCAAGDHAVNFCQCRRRGPFIHAPWGRGTVSVI